MLLPLEAEGAEGAGRSETDPTNDIPIKISMMLF